ncbi:hypothetical protein CYMTET_7907 [Cymbomonas tetramitiformis]|uniref:Uncharacterized protein n=1 Tax=Cymbomonas tetramitiformis TaxID=36881 RepID=A0AAE0LGJ2_9CHLO|nr:hypothetical protein CYMTET_7907 [Cymbomonas tetramitiformis]
MILVRNEDPSKLEGKQTEPRPNLSRVMPDYVFRSPESRRLYAKPTRQTTDATGQKPSPIVFANLYMYIIYLEKLLPNLQEDCKFIYKAEARVSSVDLSEVHKAVRDLNGLVRLHGSEVTDDKISESFAMTEYAKFITDQTGQLRKFVECLSVLKNFIKPLDIQPYFDITELLIEHVKYMFFYKRNSTEKYAELNILESPTDGPAVWGGADGKALNSNDSCDELGPLSGLVLFPPFCTPEPERSVGDVTETAESSKSSEKKIGASQAPATGTEHGDDTNRDSEMRDGSNEWQGEEDEDEEPTAVTEHADLYYLLRRRYENVEGIVENRYTIRPDDKTKNDESKSERLNQLRQILSDVGIDLSESAVVKYFGQFGFTEETWDALNSAHRRGALRRRVEDLEDEARCALDEESEETTAAFFVNSSSEIDGEEEEERDDSSVAESEQGEELTGEGEEDGESLAYLHESNPARQATMEFIIAKFMLSENDSRTDTKLATEQTYYDEMQAPWLQNYSSKLLAVVRTMIQLSEFLIQYVISSRQTQDMAQDIRHLEIVHSKIHSTCDMLRNLSDFCEVAQDELLFADIQFDDLIRPLPPSELHNLNTKLELVDTHHKRTIGCIIPKELLPSDHALSTIVEIVHNVNFCCLHAHSLAKKKKLTMDESNQVTIHLKQLYVPKTDMLLRDNNANPSYYPAFEIQELEDIKAYIALANTSHILEESRVIFMLIATVQAEFERHGGKLAYAEFMSCLRYVYRSLVRVPADDLRIPKLDISLHERIYPYITPDVANVVVSDIVYEELKKLLKGNKIYLDREDEHIGDFINIRTRPTGPCEQDLLVNCKEIYETCMDEAAISRYILYNFHEVHVHASELLESTMSENLQFETYQLTFLILCVVKHVYFELKTNAYDGKLTKCTAADCKIYYLHEKPDKDKFDTSQVKCVVCGEPYHASCSAVAQSSDGFVLDTTGCWKWICDSATRLTCRTCFKNTLKLDPERYFYFCENRTNAICTNLCQYASPQAGDRVHLCEAHESSRDSAMHINEPTDDDEIYTLVFEATPSQEEERANQELFQDLSALIERCAAKLRYVNVDKNKTIPETIATIVDSADTTLNTEDLNVAFNALFVDVMRDTTVFASLQIYDKLVSMQPTSTSFKNERSIDEFLRYVKTSTVYQEESAKQICDVAREYQLQQSENTQPAWDVDGLKKMIETLSKSERKLKFPPGEKAEQMKHKRKRKSAAGASQSEGSESESSEEDSDEEEEEIKYTNHLRLAAVVTKISKYMDTFITQSDEIDEFVKQIDRITQDYIQTHKKNKKKQDKHSRSCKSGHWRSRAICGFRIWTFRVEPSTRPKQPNDHVWRVASS